MKLQDYAHYYIGASCFNTWFTPDHDAYDAGWKLSGIRTDNEKCYMLENETDVTWVDRIALKLRRLEDMTEEDIKSFIEYDRLIKLYHNVSFNFYNNCITVHYSVDTEDEGLYPQSHEIHLFKLTPLQFHRLVKAGFDMFSLIKNGLAIGIKTITP